MKIEFLADGAVDCPLIRIFKFSEGEVENLRKACSQLADGRRAEFSLHDQPWVERVCGCRFIWRIGADDVGVRRPADGEAFVLEFTSEAWREVEEKLLPFVSGSDGYNWLTDGSDVEVLISRDGTW